jgi:hypothetical protein
LNDARESLKLEENSRMSLWVRNLILPTYQYKRCCVADWHPHWTVSKCWQLKPVHGRQTLKFDGTDGIFAATYPPRIFPVSKVIVSCCRSEAKAYLVLCKETSETSSTNAVPQLLRLRHVFPDTKSDTTVPRSSKSLRLPAPQ